MLTGKQENLIMAISERFMENRSFNDLIAEHDKEAAELMYRCFAHIATITRPSVLGEIYGVRSFLTAAFGVCLECGGSGSLEGAGERDPAFHSSATCSYCGGTGINPPLTMKEKMLQAAREFSEENGEAHQQALDSLMKRD